MGLQNNFYIGNLDAKRDWGHAKDFVKAQWLMLQRKKPEDFVATGKQCLFEILSLYLHQNLE